MNREITGLTLNNRFFNKTELLAFCKQEITANSCREWQAAVYRFILEFLDDSESISQKTSGTTGAPKTIELQKNAMLESAKITCEFFGLKENNSAILCLPIKYIAGKMMVVRAFYARLNLVLIEPGSRPDFSKLGRIDFCALVPMQASNLIEQNLWPNIKTLILGGAETNAALKTKLQKLETKVFETYGMAETCSHVALKRINGDRTENLFTAVPGVSLSQDERGCLMIEAPFLTEKIITNDCVDLKSENSFSWLGRFDNVINSGGIKIQAEELEKQFTDILHLSCAVVGKPDPLLGEKMVLIVESETERDLNDLRLKLTPHFDKKLLPKSIVRVTELPRNQNFKIDRIKLLEQV